MTRGLEAELLDLWRDAVGAGAEAGAVNSDFVAGEGVLVYDDESPCDGAAVFVGDEADLLAVEAEHGLQVVHDGVAFGLFLECGLAPGLRAVVCLSLVDDVVVLDHGFREGEHAD